MKRYLGLKNNHSGDQQMTAVVTSMSFIVDGGIYVENFICDCRSFFNIGV
jgi:hypothetical protein